MSNHTAPPEHVYVCGACGKRSRDHYGEQAISLGWDESCVLNAVLCREECLTLGVCGRVTNVREDGIVETDHTRTVPKGPSPSQLKP